MFALKSLRIYFICLRIKFVFFLSLEQIIGYNGYKTVRKFTTAADLTKRHTGERDVAGKMFLSKRFPHQHTSGEDY